MTNYEKIMRETSKQDVAEALAAYFEGSCAECPALSLCRQEDGDELGCVDVMQNWLDKECD